MSETILVAIDGTAGHDAPVRWALDRAEHTHATVELLFVIDRAWADDAAPEPALVEAADAIVASARERAQHLAPGVHVTAGWSYGKVAEQVLGAATRCDLLVLGIQRRSLLEAALIGSLSVRIATAAASTAVVVPYDWSAFGHGVVVGVDGTPWAALAAQFAATDAVLHADPLTLVCGGFSANPLFAGLVPERSVGDRRRRILGDAAGAVREHAPTAAISTLELDAHPADALVRTAHGCRLLVVGNRPRGRAERALMGSVGHDVLLNLETPVAIVREHSRQSHGHE